VENAAKENGMEYTSRGLKRRRNTDKWEVTLSHRDPLTGEQVPSYHTVAAELQVPFGDPYVLGSPDPQSRPYHPTQLTKDFKAFCEMNGFQLTFHDLRHTFATMMIAGGTDVRTVASYLGHSNVAMTLNTYAEVDPDAKRAALGKVDEAFDIDLEGIFAEPEPTTFTLEFTVGQLEAMLAEAKRREGCAE
jgi:integrase